MNAPDPKTAVLAGTVHACIALATAVLDGVLRPAADIPAEQIGEIMREAECTRALARHAADVNGWPYLGGSIHLQRSPDHGPH